MRRFLPMHRLLAIALLTAATVSGQEKLQPFGETIVVERIVIDARVTELNGEPLTGLTAADFRVRIDGKPARIESVEWVAETEGARLLAAVDKEKAATSLDPPPPAGRLIVMFFQSDFGRHHTRVTGQMKILSYADDFIAALEPEDRVAILSFDSHLKFRLDFTDDHDAIRQTMRKTLSFDEPPWPPPVPSPSLARRLDSKAMKDAGSAEEALFLLGNALRNIPGPKSLVLFGWGLGRLSGGTVRMDGYYPVAKRALEESRTSVFSVDITQADWHSLGAGLGKAAEDTGGFYASTNNFPRLAMDRLLRTLQGHYELVVLKPETKVVGLHTIEVAVPKRRDTKVMSRTTYLDKTEGDGRSQ